MAPKSKSLRGPLRPGPGTEGPQGFAYHATNEERACDIARSRKLKTHKPSEFTDQDEWPDGSVEKRSYHSKHANVVWAFAPETGPHVLLRTGLTSHPFKPEQGTGDLVTTKPISASKIEIGLDEGWVPLVSWAKKNC